VLISHRLGSVRDADRITVLSGGRVAETGDHRELLDHGGIYARLYGLQVRGYREG
jgi:ATP-binding cassette subfamily B protein